MVTENKQNNDLSSTSTVSTSLVINIDASSIKNTNSTSTNPTNELNKCKNGRNECLAMPKDCMVCSIDNNQSAPNCNYGETIVTNCTVKNYTKCIVSKINKRIDFR